MLASISSHSSATAAAPIAPGGDAASSSFARDDDARPSPQARSSRLAGLIDAIRRRSLSALGPVGVSGAHFVAALLLLRYLPTAEFGAYSFVIVLSALGLGLTNALVGAPVSSMANSGFGAGRESVPTYLKSTLAMTIGIALAVSATVYLSGTQADAAGMFGLYCGIMALRYFSRTWAYTERAVLRVILSDMTYSLTLLAGLIALLLLHRLDIFAAAIAMVVAAAVALLPFGISYFTLLLRSIRTGSVRAYRHVWRDMTRWSLLGVISTEITINAHAYIVTFVAGSKAFAVLAVGALFMRPFSLVAASLPDQERPIMARSIAAGDTKHALRIAREFLAVIAAIWLANVVLAGVVLTWFPAFVVHKGYRMSDVVAVVILWALLTAVRGIRAGDAVILQAARAFKPLADASVKSSVIALIATLILLLTAGPVASLGGILIGDIAMWVVIRRGIRDWKASVAQEAAVSDGAGSMPGFVLGN